MGCDINHEGKGNSTNRTLEQGEESGHGDIIMPDGGYFRATVTPAQMLKLMVLNICTTPVYGRGGDRKLDLSPRPLILHRG